MLIAAGHFRTRIKKITQPDIKRLIPGLYQMRLIVKLEGGFLELIFYFKKYIIKLRHLVQEVCYKITTKQYI
ncbi:hypothetical protein OIU77_007074 [Salix suchowensis]|uniref:Uncharacterized protein n=1 Tax=Salix suchowensis TaxID=1278906 RepID=A0ABQ9AMU9_9ROSI|nr:hypothetical protein OIU77_007074 [Salix suchowensis]